MDRQEKAKCVRMLFYKIKYCFKIYKGYNWIPQMSPRTDSIQRNISWCRNWNSLKVHLFGKRKASQGLEMKVKCSFVYCGFVGQKKGLLPLSILKRLRNVTAFLYFGNVNGRGKVDCHKREMAGLVLQSNYSQLDRAFCPNIACGFTEGKKVQGIFPFPL